MQKKKKSAYLFQLLMKVQLLLKCVCEFQKIILWDHFLN